MYVLPFMFQEFSGERFLFLVTADGQVLLEILALLLQSQRQHFLLVGLFPFVGQLPLEPWRQLLQLLLPLFLLIAKFTAVKQTIGRDGAVSSYITLD